MTHPTFAEIYRSLLYWDVCDDPNDKAVRWLEFRALTKHHFSLRHLIIALELGEEGALKLLNHVINLGIENEKREAAFLRSLQRDALLRAGMQAEEISSFMGEAT